MRILFDSRWIAPHGIGRVAREYRDRLVRDFDVVELSEGPKPSHATDWWFLGQAFRRSQADLLFVPGYNGTPLAGKRQIFIIHDLIHFGRAEPTGFRKRLYYNSITRLAAARGTVLTVSQASADELARRWPETKGRISVVPNGVSGQFRNGTTEPGTTRAGLVLFGNGRWHKNLAGMLKAIALWQRQGRPAVDATVTIIGPDEPSRSLAARAGVRNLVFAGGMTDENAAELLTRSAALLFCSHAEGFGLPILEAVACGCPVVASDIAVMREVGKTGCVFVDPNSAEDMAGGIDRATALAVDEAARQALVARHDWEASYDLVAAHIRDLTDSLGPRRSG
jgi:glycosyltransferase involved in cell wall biosynthesis